MRALISVFILLLGVTLAWCADEDDQPSALRAWTSSSGSTVEAEYAGLERGRALLRKSDGTMLKISAASLSKKDQVWIQEEEAKRKAPAGVRLPLKPHELPVFDGGEWNRCHAVYTTDAFDVQIDNRGIVRVYPKERGERVGQPIRFNLDCYYRDARKSAQMMPVTAYKEAPDPQVNPKSVTLEGVLSREVPFRVTYEFSDQGIKAYGYCEDPPSIDFPTVFSFRFQFAPTHKNDDLSMEEQRKILNSMKDWQVVLTPVKGKSRTFPYTKAVHSMGGETRQLTLDPPVYGERRISVETGNPKEAPLIANIYRTFCPWQGFSLRYNQEDGNSRNNSHYVFMEIK